MPRLENVFDNASCSADRMWTAKRELSMKAGSAAEVLAKLHSTMGGSSDTELKLLAVRPTSLPSASSVVTMVTPVANEPRALRKPRESRFASLAALLVVVVMPMSPAPRGDYN